MIEEVFNQGLSNLPLITNRFKGLSQINLVTVFNPTLRCPFSNLPFFQLARANINTIKEQCSKFTFIHWQDQEHFNKHAELPNDGEQFWIDICNYDLFKKLATPAPTCLITPVSKSGEKNLLSCITSKDMSKK